MMLINMSVFAYQFMAPIQQIIFFEEEDVFLTFSFKYNLQFVNPVLLPCFCLFYQVAFNYGCFILIYLDNVVLQS